MALVALESACSPATRQQPIAAPVSATTPADGMDAAAGLDAASTSDGALGSPGARADATVARRGPAGPLPNLTINGTRIARSAQFEWRDFGPNSCDIREGCLTTPGRRRLLRFDLETPNDGPGDVVIGHPTPGDPRFEFSTCHGHRHFLGYARYSLRDASGAEVARGHKQSFCLMDSQRTGRVPGRRQSRYTCQGDQGIQAGWADVYERNLDCQYVDVTDVPPGHYQLDVEINISHGIEENNYDDNRVRVDIDVPAGGDAGLPDAGMPNDSLMACPASISGEDRDCGWTRVTTRSCTPGASVTVACNQGCATPLGSCTGDPMLRICAGPNGCSHLTMLGQNDDGCPPVRGGMNACPIVVFTCPPEGRYSILTAPYVSTATATCSVGVQ